MRTKKQLHCRADKRREGSARCARSWTLWCTLAFVGLSSSGFTCIPHNAKVPDPPTPKQERGQAGKQQVPASASVVETKKPNKAIAVGADLRWAKEKFRWLASHQELVSRRKLQLEKSVLQPKKELDIKGDPTKHSRSVELEAKARVLLARLKPQEPSELVHEERPGATKRRRLVIPMPRDPRFQRVLLKYRTSYWGFTWTILQNRGRYEVQMRRQLRAIHAPEELFLLPGIESNYGVRLISPVGAMGSWQFMKKTAERFGLKVGAWKDERRSINKATVAAARYLLELYKHFGRWEYALASYNCGEKCVERAIRRCPGMSFWKMRVTAACNLPWETREYVARFFSMLYYARNPQKFPRPIYVEPPVVLSKVQTGRPVSLPQISRYTGLSLEALHASNPELSSWASAPDEKDYPLLVPPKYEKAVRAFLREGHGSYRVQVVRVKPGQAVFRIANRYGLSAYEMKTFNRIGQNTVPTGVRYLMFPLPRGKSRWQRTRSELRLLGRLLRDVRQFRRRFPPGLQIRKRATCHVARAGQSLTGIGRLYGMSPYRIRLYNPGVESVSSGMLIRLRYGVNCAEYFRKMAEQRKAAQQAKNATNGAAPTPTPTP